MKNTPDGGPAPVAPAGTASAELLRESPARARVAAALADAAGPTAVADLAATLGGHPNTTRVQLDALVAAGLAVRDSLPAVGRGRPRQAYRLTDDGTAAVAAVRTGTDTLGAEYLGLAAAFAEHLAHRSSHPDDEARAVGHGWGRRLADGAAASSPATPAPATPTPAPATPAPSARVVHLLDRLGFSPAPAVPADADEHGLTLRLRTCPLLDLARANPEVICSVHEGLVTGALETFGARRPAVRLEPFAEPDACLLHLGRTPRR